MAIDVTGLTKRYREKVAVDDISFSVADGGVFAFVGTNGAGKSTTIGCLTTVLPFDAGEVRVRGYDVRHEGERVREAIGVVFQESLLDPLLTVRENLRLRGRLSRVSRASLEAKIARGRRSDRSRRVPGQALRKAVRRPTTTGRHRPCPASRTGGAVPRRTDGGTRPGQSRAGLGAPCTNSAPAATSPSS